MKNLSFLDYIYSKKFKSINKIEVNYIKQIKDEIANNNYNSE